SRPRRSSLAGTSGNDVWWRRGCWPRRPRDSVRRPPAGRRHWWRASCLAPQPDHHDVAARGIVGVDDPPVAGAVGATARQVAGDKGAQKPPVLAVVVQPERRPAVERIVIVDQQQVSGIEAYLGEGRARGLVQRVKRGLRLVVEPSGLGEVAAQPRPRGATVKNPDRSYGDGMLDPRAAQECAVDGGGKARLVQDVDGLLVEQRQEHRD